MFEARVQFGFWGGALLMVSGLRFREFRGLGFREAG